MAEDHQLAAIEQDLQHFSSTGASVAHDADLVLSVSDGNRVIEFPVHRKLVCAHCPVLKDLLHDTRDVSEQNDSQQLLRLPMIGDTHSAVRTLVEHLYSSCAPGHSDLKLLHHLSYTSSPNTILQHINSTRCFHKYGMTKLQLDSRERRDASPAAYSQ